MRHTIAEHASPRHDDRTHRAGVGWSSGSPEGQARPLTGGRTRELCVVIVGEGPLIVQGLRTMLSPAAPTVHVHADEPGMRRPGLADVTFFDPARRVPATCPTLDTLLGDPARGRIVVFSVDPPPALVSEWLARGCAGFVDKGAPSVEFVEVLTSVATQQRATARGGAYVTHPCPADAWPGQGHGLSRRESEMVCLISRGLTNDDICDHAALSINTVKTYIRSAYAKLGITRRPQAVRWGLQHGMSDPAPGYVAAAPGCSHYQGRSA